MKVKLTTFVVPVKGTRKSKNIEVSVDSISDLKRISESLDLLKQTVIDSLVFDDGSNDFIKFSISIDYEKF